MKALRLKIARRNARRIGLCLCSKPIWVPWAFHCLPVSFNFSPLRAGLNLKELSPASTIISFLKNYCNCSSRAYCSKLSNADVSAKNLTKTCVRSNALLMPCGSLP
jgi:hypothetical protein